MLLAALLLPGVGAGDPRNTVDGDSLPWSAVVRVQIAGVSRCSGFLLGPRRVVTAAHCLYGAQVQHLLWPGAVHVLSQYRNGAFAGHSVAVSYRVGAGYDPRDGGRGAGADVAVLTLAQPVGGGALTLGRAHPGDAAMLGGYNQDRGEVLLADRYCRVLGTLEDGGQRPLTQHSCSGTHGTSGAPLLVRDAAGAWVAAGVQVAAVEGDVGGLAAPAQAVQAVLDLK